MSVNFCNVAGGFRCYHKWLSIVLLFISKIIIAQTDDFNFINYNSKDGLSANAVNVILKDKFGYMWFGTDDGLNKFDGENFTVYRHKPGDSTSLGGNRISAISQDALGNLWVGTSESLSYYDRKKDAFVQHSLSGKPFVRALCLDHEGNLWAGSYTGLYKLNIATGKVMHYAAVAEKPDQLNSNTVVAVFEDTHRRLWIGTNDGLHLFLPNSNSFRRFRHDPNNPRSISNNIVRSIAEDLKGNIWIGTDEGGVSMFRNGNDGFERCLSNPADGNTLSSNRVFAIAPDSNGRLWIGTDAGINILNPERQSVLRIVNDPRNKYSLSDKSVRSIYIDKNGIYWVGTYQGGVNKYDKNLPFFNLRQSNEFDQFGLNAPRVTSFVENRKGDIYIGTNGGGLNFYDRKTGRFSHINLGKNSESIQAMTGVGDEIWIGTNSYGLYILNMLTKKVMHHGKGNGHAGLSSNDIQCFKRDRSGNIWIGTNGDGIDVFKPGIGIVSHFGKNTSNAEIKLPLNGFIRAIEEDQQGNIWIGSNGSGIALYHPSTGSFRLLNRENSNLPLNNITTIYCDSSGIVWVGTLGGGLSRFDNNGKFISYSEQEGLSNSVVHKILESAYGKLWLSTNKGISSFDIATQKFKNYTYRNGLQQSTFLPGAGLKTSKGELFFGGLDGFNFFNPKALATNRVTPSLSFTDLKIANRSVVPGSGEPIKEHISVAEKITLDYKQSFSLDFVALNYTSPEESRYSYKLEGFDKNWNYVGNARKAVYTNLDPGTYTFRLKAESDDKSWSSPETSISIYVQPPLWRTVYAYIFYALLIAGFLIAWRYWGIRRLKNKFALEQERLRFKQMLEREQQQHETDQAKIKFLTNLSHEFRTPISLIMAPVEKLLQKEANKEKAGQLNLIRRNARRLLNLVNELLDLRKLEEKELTLNMVNADFVSFVQEVADSFKDLSERKHIDFYYGSSLPHYYTSFDRDKIERILFNLLSNAFKFTGTEGKVCLELARYDAGICLTISDTGVGISQEAQGKIFERFYQGESNPAFINQGSGIGLSITREFVKLHGGSIEVKSTEGQGSSFIVSLPLKPLQQLPVMAGEDITNEFSENESKDEDGSKAVVLLVEDHQEFRQYLEENLKKKYKIIQASDGKEGWQKALSAHPDIIVSDINMPEMDGIVLCRKLKSDKRTSHIPVILLTALTGDSNQLRGLNTGASDYLTKPFNFDILNIRIKNLLESNRHLKEVYTRQLKVVPAPGEVQSESERLLLAVTQYIEANLESPALSVEDLGNFLHMSRGSVYNKILAITGLTPVEFIRSIKLQKALVLLETTDLNISEVGYKVGFRTPNYFAKAFKAKYNQSPTEFVKRKRK